MTEITRVDALAVHPVADLFPMLAEDELRDLAADIAERGLLQPIVLDAEGRILDGRNRYAACELAEVEPTFATYDGDDPDGYALSVNIARRHLTKGQQAMVIARALRSSDSGRKRGVEQAAETTGLKRQRISEATTVLDFASGFVEDVIAGRKPLNEAYEVAREIKKTDESDKARKAELRKLAPDLAVLVENDIRDLTDALEEAEHRKKVREIDEIRDADGAPPPSFTQRATDGSITWDEAATLARQWQTERGEAITRAQNCIRQINSGWGVVRTVIDQAGTAYVADIIAGLGEPDRTKFDDIIAEVKG